MEMAGARQGGVSADPPRDGKPRRNHWLGGPSRTPPPSPHVPSIVLKCCGRLKKCKNNKEHERNGTCSCQNQVHERRQTTPRTLRAQLSEVMLELVRRAARAALLLFARVMMFLAGCFGGMRLYWRYVLGPTMEFAEALSCRHCFVRTEAVGVPEYSAPIQARWLTTTPERDLDVEVAVLYIHGGGGTSHTVVERRIAQMLLPLLEADAAFLAASYSLMPDGTHAEQRAQCLEQYDRLLQLGARHIVVMGDSHGGNLALSTLAVIAAEPAGGARRRALVDAAVVISPWLPSRALLPPRGSLSGLVASMITVATAVDDYLATASLVPACRNYFRAGGWDRPELLGRLSAAGDALPQTLCIAGGGETLLPDAEAVCAAVLRRTTLLVAPGECHDYPNLNPIFVKNLAAPAEAWARAAALVNAALAARGACSRRPGPKAAPATRRRRARSPAASPRR